MIFGIDRMAGACDYSPNFIVASSVSFRDLPLEYTETHPSHPELVPTGFH